MGKVPKKAYGGEDACQVTTESATVDYIVGFCRIQDVHERLELHSREHFHDEAMLKDCWQIKQASKKVRKKAKKQNKTLRVQGKGFLNEEKCPEGGQLYQFWEQWLRSSILKMCRSLIAFYYMFIFESAP